MYKNDIFWLKPVDSGIENGHFGVVSRHFSARIPPQTPQKQAPGKNLGKFPKKMSDSGGMGVDKMSILEYGIHIITKHKKGGDNTERSF
jgi:hypothetical protein